MLFCILLAIFFHTAFAAEISDPTCGQPKSQSVIFGQDSDKILDGTVAKPHSWPWEVSFQLIHYDEGDKIQHLCSGSIIARNKILCTACFVQHMTNEMYATTNPNDYGIVVGFREQSVAESMTRVYNITEFSLPGLYNVRKGLIPVIMVITLAEELVYDEYTSPICLSKNRPVVGSTCYASKRDQNLSVVPIDIQIQDPSLCLNQSFYFPIAKYFNDSNMICGGHRHYSKKECAKNMGASLVCLESGKWLQYGIANYVNCFQENSSIIYTSVPYYYDWLQKQMYSDEKETITTKTPKPADPMCGKPSIQPVIFRPDNDKIFVGEVAKPHSWPWQVSLHTFENNRMNHICGGTIISMNKILCAAHCLIYGMNQDRYEIVVGLHDRYVDEPTARVFQIKNFSLPQSFDFNNNLIPDDIMVITLTEDLKYNEYMMPICLAKNRVAIGSTCYVTGWGRNASEKSAVTSAVLRQVDIPIQDPSLCKNQEIHGNTFNDTKMLCAGHLKGGRDSCQGDSGGPLVCLESGKWFQYGIVSTGIGCGQKDEPGIYTLVSYYYDWLQRQI